MTLASGGFDGIDLCHAESFEVPGLGTECFCERGQRKTWKVRNRGCGVFRCVFSTAVCTYMHMYAGSRVINRI